jgi:hypothetical protein
MHTDRSASSSPHVAVPTTAMAPGNAPSGQASVPARSVSNAPADTPFPARAGLASKRGYIGLATVLYGRQLMASPSLRRDIDDATCVNLDGKTLAWGLKASTGAESLPKSTIHFSCPDLGLAKLLLALEMLAAKRGEQSLPATNRAQLDVLGWKMIMAVGSSGVLDGEDAASLRMASQRHPCFSHQGRALLGEIRSAAGAS